MERKDGAIYTLNFLNVRNALSPLEPRNVHFLREFSSNIEEIVW